MYDGPKNVSHLLYPGPSFIVRQRKMYVLR